MARGLQFIEIIGKFHVGVSFCPTLSGYHINQVIKQQWYRLLYLTMKYVKKRCIIWHEIQTLKKPILFIGLWGVVAT